MNTIVISLAAIVLYLLTAAGIGATLFRPADAVKPSMPLNLGLGFTAIVLHAVALRFGMVTDGGFDLGVFNASSLVAWIIALIVFTLAARRSLANLALIFFPVAALAIGLELAFSSHRMMPDRTPLGLDLHVALSLLAYSVLSIAALQAVMLTVADRQIRRKRPLGVMHVLPPLATMETLLFQLIGVGWLLLGLGIAAGFIFVEDLFAQHLVHKTVLSLLAWLTFALLLLGRWRYGWRGRIAVRYTLAGFGLLMLAFFGSKAVLELVLNRN
jgi:ABC-type uncharacterized transport system permease subunit